MPASLKPWLDEPGSLTARMQRLAGGRLTVEVLYTGWSRPAPDEARALGMHRHRYGWVREVVLGSGGAPWIYARTVIPRRTLTGRQRALLRLGGRPLGSVLFGPASISRGPVVIACLRHGDWLHARGARHDEVRGPLWARRSQLRVEGKPLLVTEVFLPSLLERL